MKVYGQLEYAQLQNLTVTPGNTPLGLLYADISTPSAALPKFWDGTTMQTLAFVQGAGASLFNAGNSGKAITINWNNGVNQIVTLSNHCVISFSNPQAGKVHRLTIKQVAGIDLSTVFPFQFCFAMPDQYSRLGSYQPVQIPQMNSVGVFAWLYNATSTAASGVAAAFTLYQVPAVTIQNIGISPKGDRMILASSTSPFLYNYNFSNDGLSVLVSAGPNAVTQTAAAAAVVSLDVHPSGLLYAYAVTTTVTQTIWLADGNHALTNAVSPGGTVTSLKYCPDGSSLAIGFGTSPFLKVYKSRPDLWLTPTVYANPATLPTGGILSLDWCKSGDYLAVAMNATPYLRIYPMSYISGLGTPVDPTDVPAAAYASGLGHTISFHPYGSYVCIITGTTPFLHIASFDRNLTIGTHQTISGSSIPSSQPAACAFSPCGNYLAVVGTTYLNIYPFDPVTGLAAGQAPLALPTALPALVPTDVAWTPNSETVMVSGTSTPYIQAYTAPRVARNYVRIND